jgi:repressor LexA
MTSKVLERAEQLRRFVQARRRMPSYTEMLPLFGVRSRNMAFKIVLALARHGYLHKDAAGRLAPTDRLAGTVRVLGAVAAGFPSPAEEALLDTLKLDEFLIARPEATFLLRVEGDSMLDAGIHPGDLVLVERGRRPRNRDIVIAQVDGDWTMKYYEKDADGVRLEPANARYRTIRPKRSLEVAGVVTCVIRKYA